MAKQGLLARQWRLEQLPLEPEDGRLAGALLGRTHRSNSMDALTVAVASRHRFNQVLTSDPVDLTLLRDSLRAPEWRDIAIVDIR